MKMSGWGSFSSYGWSSLFFNEDIVGGAHIHCVSLMSEEQGQGGKNFRSAYYESLGFRESEKCISQLDHQLKVEVIGTVEAHTLDCLSVSLRYT